MTRNDVRPIQCKVERDATREKSEGGIFQKFATAPGLSYFPELDTQRLLLMIIISATNFYENQHNNIFI